MAGPMKGLGGMGRKWRPPNPPIQLSLALSVASVYAGEAVSSSSSSILSVHQELACTPKCPPRRFNMKDEFRNIYGNIYLAIENPPPNCDTNYCWNMTCSIASWSQSIPPDFVGQTLSIAYRIQGEADYNGMYVDEYDVLCIRPMCWIPCLWVLASVH